MALICLYRENAIAFESEAKEPFGNVYYVTMQITLHIPKFARKERNLQCDVVHITTKWVLRLTLDHIQPGTSKIDIEKLEDKSKRE